MAAEGLPLSGPSDNEDGSDTMFVHDVFNHLVMERFLDFTGPQIYARAEDHRLCQVVRGLLQRAKQTWNDMEARVLVKT